MTPVISPWVFYWMPICDKVSFVSTLFFFILCLSLVITCCYYFTDYECYDADELRRFKLIIKTLIILTIITGLLACFLPNEETIIKMIVAQNVTVERVDMVSDTVVTVYNDIMNLFRDSGAANG